MISHICIQHDGRYVELLAANNNVLMIWNAAAKLHMLAGPAA